MGSHNVMENWGARYSAEVKRSTERYEALNVNAPTIIRKVTQEEIDLYNQSIKKSQSCHKLCLNR